MNEEEAATSLPAVVVLAAGMGTRLGGQSAVPKWLVSIGPSTIAEHQLATFAASRESWARLVVVSGYQSHLFDRAWIGGASGGPVDLIQNPHFADYNNWYSLLVALRHLAGEGWPGPVCVVNSDLVISAAEVASFLAASYGESRNLLAVDARNPTTDESMKVTLKPDGTVAEIAKSGLRLPVHGEYVGLSTLSRAGYQLLADVLETFESEPARHDAWYEAGFAEAMASGVPFHLHELAGSDWVEVDDLDDLERARALVAGGSLACS